MSKIILTGDRPTGRLHIDVYKRQVVIQGPTFSGTNATGHDNVVTFSHCTLKAFNEPNAEPQHILSLQYGACNNTVYFNDCVIEQNTSGSIVHMDEDATGNHVFVDGREIQANTCLLYTSLPRRLVLALIWRSFCPFCFCLIPCRFALVVCFWNGRN